MCNFDFLTMFARFTGTLPTCYHNFNEWLLYMFEKARDQR
jgi:hypothetical protein